MSVSWAITGAALAVVASILSAQMALAERFSECGTGRAAATFNLLTLPPVASILPALGCYLTRRSRGLKLICRCSLWAGLAAWATACCCVLR